MPCQQPFSYKYVCIYILHHKIVLIVFNRWLPIYQFASVENNCYWVQTNWIAFKLFINYSLFTCPKEGLKTQKVYINNHTPQTAYYYEKECTLFLSCKLYTWLVLDSPYPPPLAVDHKKIHNSYLQKIFWLETQII